MTVRQENGTHGIGKESLLAFWEKKVAMKTRESYPTRFKNVTNLDW